MTRIIGGSARGRRLRTPPGEGTRPTSDRVREALFSALEAEFGSLDGLRVLDLFAGSGAVGLEALSRGAAAVLLVESDRRAAAVIDDNRALVGLSGAAVTTAPVAAALAGPPAGGPYDVVFLDPPYPLGEEALADVLDALVEHEWLVDDAVVVVERSSRSPEPRWPEGLRSWRQKVYGETTLWYVLADVSGPDT